MEIRTIKEIAKQEFTVNVRNKWTLLFAIVFGILVLTISYFGLMASGFSGFANFSRTSASLLNLVLYLIPLIALMMGTMSFTSEKGSSELLFSQPLSRSEILLGKLIGLFTSILVSTLLGFGIAGAMVAVQTGMEGAWRFLTFVGLSLVLGLVFLSLSILVSMVCKRKSRAIGVALFVWFFYVLFYDLLIIGITLLLTGKTVNMFVFLSLFGNPVDMIRVVSLIVLDGLSIFGISGAMLVRFFGGTLGSLILTVTLFLGWISFPLFLSNALLRKQDI